MNPIGAVSTVFPWQLDAWSSVTRQLDGGHLAHALLLVGERYTGKEHFALALARMLLCHSPADGLNCGRCHGCELSRMGSHSDFRWLHPELPSRVIKVDQVRELVDFVGKTASLGQRKVVLISPADSMNTAAANALLKSLEEPSPDTHIILVSHRLQGLPATVRSRCQMLKFVMPSCEQSLTWLDSLTSKRADSKTVLDLTQGKVMLASKLYADADLTRAEQMAGILRQLFAQRGKLVELDGLMSEQSLDDLLAQVQVHVQERLRTMDQLSLAGASGRAAFALMDEVVLLQRAVVSGSNPNRQLLVESLGAHFDAQLGAA